MTTEELAEVIAEEDAEEARNLPAVIAHEAMVTRAEVTPEEVREQRDKIVQVMKTVMVRDQHYGVIPGVNKPTLLKAGAEVLAVTFRLAPHYDSERIFHDDGHLTVVSKVALVHIPSGLTIAEGEGLCTSREKKYAYRSSGRVCPECSTAGTIKRSKYPPREAPQDDPGWYCFAKVGGCGANFPYTDERITSQEEKPVPNPDLADMFNTVLKMSNKRALIAAILNGTAASDIFAQDMEDAAPHGEEAQPQPERRVTQTDEVTVPRSGAEVKARLEALLGDDEAAVWGAQAKDAAKDLPAPSFFQRMCGVIVDLTEQGGEWMLRPDPRQAIQQVFASRLDGLILAGPDWALDGAEAEAGTPSKEEVMSRG